MRKMIPQCLISTADHEVRDRTPNEWAAIVAQWQVQSQLAANAAKTRQKTNTNLLKNHRILQRLHHRIIHTLYFLFVNRMIMKTLSRRIKKIFQIPNHMTQSKMTLCLLTKRTGQTSQGK